LVARVGGEGVI